MNDVGIIQLNVGCGRDYKDGFVNIDIDPLVNPDVIMDFTKESLLTRFTADSVDSILAHGIIEHFWRGDAISFLKDCFTLMKLGGKIEFLLPDFDAIIKMSDMSSERMLEFLFGAQHINQGPQLYGHKYGHTRQSFSDLLTDIGFTVVHIADAATSMLLTAEKS